MSGQVVLMNTDGVALASDYGSVHNEKQAGNTTSKLFSISKEHAIGIMVYGTASVFQTPWDTLIKGYKNKLNGPFNTVYEYAADFLQFLNQSENEGIMAEANEIVYAETSLHSIVMNLHNDLADMKLSIYSEEYMALSPGEFQKIYLQHAEDLLNSRIQQLDQIIYPIGYSVCDYELLFGLYAEKITQMIYRTFEFHLYRIEWLEKIKHLVIDCLIKEFFNEYAGIIFTGYGDREEFPSLCVLSIDGKLNHKMKFLVRQRLISNITPGILFPFPDGNTLKSFRLETLQFAHDNLTEPIQVYINHSDVTELADLSKSLLKEADLKKKFLGSVESISNLIDVAVVTKGEGFKRLK